MKNLKKLFTLLVSLVFFSQIISVIPVKAEESMGNDINQIEEALKLGKDWIVKNQNEDGTWGKNDDTKLFISSEVYLRLNKDEKFSGNLEKLREEIKKYEYKNNDYNIRKEKITNENKFLKNLKEIQNTNGGFGLYKGYDSNNFDTELILQSILDEENVDIDLAIKAISFLVSNQNVNGSWSYIRGGEEDINLTSSISITLRYFRDKCKLTSNDIETAINKGGEYLRSNIETIKKDNKNLSKILLCYRAMLKTVGIDKLQEVKSYVLSNQNKDGSWGNDIVTSLYALDLLNDINVVEKNTEKCEITKLETFKLQEDKLIDSSSFMAQEKAFINVGYKVDNAENYSLNMFVRGSDGIVQKVSKQNDIYFWSVGASSAGKYQLIVQLVDKDKNIIDEKSKELSVESTFAINSVILNTSRESIRVDEETNINFSSNISIDTNQNIKLLAELNLVDEGGNKIYSKTNEISVDKATTFNTNLGEIQIKAVAGKKYFVNLKLIKENETISQINKELKVLPKLPATRIEISQNTEKDWVYSGKDEVKANYLLKGIGTPVLPDRKPYDLILAIDISSSVSNEYLDAQKQAAKKLVGLMREDDRLGIMVFGSTDYCQLLLSDAMSSQKDKLYEVIDSIKSLGYDNGTHIGIPIRKATEVLRSKDSGNRNKMILLISDAGSWGDESDTIEAKNNNIKVSTVAIEANRWPGGQPRMNAIASNTEGTYYPTNSVAEILARMDEFMGSIFNYAGTDVTCELNVPNKNMLVKEVTPKADSITQNIDGSKTYRWSLKNLIMGQTSTISVVYEGSNLKQDTEEVLSNNFKVSYINLNKEKENEQNSELKISVAKFKIDNLVKLSNKEVLPKEDLKIGITSKNMTKYDNVTNGRIEILDSNENVIKTLDNFDILKWNPYESKELNYIWNAEENKSGKYIIRITWQDKDDNKIVQNEEFIIKSDGAYSNKVSTDKIEYSSNEDVLINTMLFNTSSNSILQNAKVKTFITNTNGITTCLSTTNINEIQSKGSLKLKESWNTEKNKAGEYVITSILYDDKENIINEDKVLFKIKETLKLEEEAKGTLSIDKHGYTDKEELQAFYKLINIGNLNIEDFKYDIKILDINGNEVDTILSNKISLNIDAVFDGDFKLPLSNLDEGEYFCVLQAENKNGEKSILDWQRFQLKKEVGLRIQLRNEWNQWVSENTIYPQIRVYNDSDKPIDLQGLSLRYYYTTEGKSDDQFIYDWGSVFRTYVKGTIHKSDDYKDNYLQVEFLKGSGVLRPGEYIELQTRIIKSNWSDKFDQSNDYSFNYKTTEFVDWNKITAYREGKKVWGVEP